MANTNPVSFLLNQSSDEGQAVSAPAFSITKVIATAAVVLTPLTTLLVKQIANLKFSSGQVVLLILGVLGLLAFTSAADVLARSIATRASVAGGIDITPALKATLISEGRDPDIQVVGLRANGADTALLVAQQGQPLTWVPASSVDFG